jgi:hypothetical protein
MLAHDFLEMGLELTQQRSAGGREKLEGEVLRFDISHSGSKKMPL